MTLDLSPLSRYRGALFSDFSTLIDAALPQSLHARQISEIVSLVDQILSVRLSPRLSGDTVSVAETIGQSHLWNVLVDSPLTVIDEVIRSIISGGGSVVRVASDVLLLSDGTTRVLLRAGAVTEAVVAADGSPVRGINRNASLSEALTLLDGFLANRLRRVVTNEGVTLIDLMTASASGNRVVSSSDAILVGDSSIASSLHYRSAADIMGLSDGQLRSLQRLMTLVEGITFNDGQLRVSFWSRQNIEALDITDESVRQILYAVLYDTRATLGRSTPLALLGSDEYIAALGRDKPIATLGVHH